ncbi:MAG: Hsp20/alpha crystallin family protein [Thermodesulfobacteriota bacterium]
MVIDFNSFYDLPREIARIMDEAARPLLISQRRTAYPLVNLAEDRDNYYVDLDMPGVDAAKVDLTLTERNLTVKGERPAQSGRFYRQERVAGTFQRIITLGAPVDKDKAAARYADGILRITLPKSEAVKPRKITIESA